jgi:RNA polymerase sigma-70 factor (ECF subfamily)
MSDQRPAVVLHLQRPAPEGAPLEARDDDELMALAVADHRRAFEVLAARHLGALSGFCAKFLGSRAAGEEIAQDVLVEAWTGRRRYRAEGRFRVYLLGVARLRCLNRLRDDRLRWTRAPALADPPGLAAAHRDQLDDLLERERERRVRAALLTLSPKLREAVLLRFDRGLDYAEIAGLAGHPEATVRSRVFLAIRRLRDELAGSEEP